MASEASPSARQHAAAALYDHPSTLAKIERLLPLLPDRSLRIFDAGCGDGRLAQALCGRGHMVRGLDANADAVRLAAERGIDAAVADLESPWPVPDRSVDCVLLLDVLEHLVDPGQALREAHRVLPPDGYAIVAFPNHFDLRQRLEMVFGRGIVHWSHRKYAEHDPSRYAHLRFLRLEDLQSVIRGSGFVIRVWQWNFMGGGIVPRRLLPRSVRTFLTRAFPNLFSGKFIALLEKRLPSTDHCLPPKTIVLPETPEGL